MEGGRTSKNRGAPTPDETFGRKEDVRRPSVSSSEYFNRVFSPMPHADLYRSLSKPRAEEQEGDGSTQTKNSDAGLLGSKSQGDHNQNEKSFYTNEPVESSCFGSALNYGGRDFYTTSFSPRTFGNIKRNGIDGVDDANFATRGEWWQGSYHY